MPNSETAFANYVTQNSCLIFRHGEVWNKYFVLFRRKADAFLHNLTEIPYTNSPNLPKATVRASATTTYITNLILSISDLTFHETDSFLQSITSFTNFTCFTTSRGQGNQFMIGVLKLCVICQIHATSANMWQVFPSFFFLGWQEILRSKTVCLSSHYSIVKASICIFPLVSISCKPVHLYCTVYNILQGRMIILLRTLETHRLESYYKPWWKRCRIIFAVIMPVFWCLVGFSPLLNTFELF